MHFFRPNDGGNYGRGRLSGQSAGSDPCGFGYAPPGLHTAYAVAVMTSMFYAAKQARAPFLARESIPDLNAEFFGAAAGIFADVGR